MKPLEEVDEVDDLRNLPNNKKLYYLKQSNGYLSEILDGYSSRNINLYGLSDLTYLPKMQVHNVIDVSRCRKLKSIGENNPKYVICDHKINLPDTFREFKIKTNGRVIMNSSELGSYASSRRKAGCAIHKDETVYVNTDLMSFDINYIEQKLVYEYIISCDKAISIKTIQNHLVENGFSLEKNQIIKLIDRLYYGGYINKSFYPGIGYLYIQTDKSMIFNIIKKQPIIEKMLNYGRNIIANYDAAITVGIITGVVIEIKTSFTVNGDRYLNISLRCVDGRSTLIKVWNYTDENHEKLVGNVITFPVVYSGVLEWGFNLDIEALFGTKIFDYSLIYGDYEGWENIYNPHCP